MYKSIVLGLCLIVVLVYAHEGKSHHCIHDELEVNEGRSAMEFEFMKNPSSKDQRAIQQNNAPPHDYMRTKLEAVLDADAATCYRAGDVVQTRSGDSYTCTQNDIMSTNKRQYVIDIANEALAILSATLKVVRLASLTIPATSCGSAPGVTVPDAYKNGGVAGIDFVLFLTARPIPSTSSTSQVLAYASSCWATLYGRSIAGHANFNPSALDLDPASRRRQVAVALHEITHALGYSSGKFNDFIRWVNATAYQSIDISEVYLQTTLTGWKSASFIKSPNVLAFVRKHFNCDSLPGAEIEDGGGGGTAGSHWEKRTFNNEYMTGSEVEWSVFSPLTLAYFADSGWYQIDDTKAQPLVWGINQGCNFAMKQCLTGNWPTGDGYLCQKSTTGTSEPTFDRVGYGICNYVTYSSTLPSQFQNIPGKPSDGGASQLADYCTYIQYNTLCTNQPSDKSVLNTAEQYCDTCRVFQANLGSVTNKNSCYNVTCAADDDLRVQVESIWYKCPLDGGSVQPYNFEGSIDCEPKAATILCPQVALQPADLWPVYESIDPTSGGPGTNVTIKGSNLSKVTAIKIGPGISTNVVVVSDTEIQAVAPDASNYGSLVFLSGAKVLVGVIDDQGRSDYKLEEFELKTELNSGFIDAFGKWIEANPIWFSVIIVGAVGVIGCVIFCICRCCKKKKKGKPKRGQYHEKGGNIDHYYNEDYVRAQAASRG